MHAALPALAGEIEQVPPAASAVHVDGERAYRRFRRGEAVTVPPRT
ncbi:MAG: tRNA pseudouridine(55) synthase TruB, partial [Actinomycetota bacterium]